MTDALVVQVVCACGIVYGLESIKRHRPLRAITTTSRRANRGVSCALAFLVALWVTTASLPLEVASLTWPVVRSLAWQWAIQLCAQQLLYDAVVQPSRIKPWRAS